MNRMMICAIVLLGFAGGPLLVGCDTVEHTKSVDVKNDGTVVKKDDVAGNEKIEADRAQETWDSEGGRASRPDESGARQPSELPVPPPSRRVGERRQGDRRT